MQFVPHVLRNTLLWEQWLSINHMYIRGLPESSAHVAEYGASYTVYDFRRPRCARGRRPRARGTMLTTMPTSLHHRAIEHLGARIVAGELPAGHVMLAEHLEDELKVSRSVVREAVRVLQSLGLVETMKRVGIRVLPANRWNPFDPLVIRWRLAGEGRGGQLRSLAELRTAVEPVAAELAAGNAPDELRRELVEVSHAMRDAGRGRRRAAVPGAGHPLPFPAADAVPATRCSPTWWARWPRR